MQNPDDYYTPEQKAFMSQPQIATLQPTDFTSWQPEPGWLFLLPSRSSGITEGNILLPESAIKKSNSGICFLQGHIAGEKPDQYLDKECLFPQHTEYKVIDTDTGYEIYILPADKVIMTRIPPLEIAMFSRAKAKGLSFEEFQTEHPTK